MRTVSYGGAVSLDGLLAGVNEAMELGALQQGCAAGEDNSC